MFAISASECVSKNHFLKRLVEQPPRDSIVFPIIRAEVFVCRFVPPGLFIVVLLCSKDGELVLVFARPKFWLFLASGGGGLVFYFILKSKSHSDPEDESLCYSKTSKVFSYWLDMVSFAMCKTLEVSKLGTFFRTKLRLIHP